MFIRKLRRCSSACVRPRRTQNQITKRTQSDPLFSTRAENESQIPPTEAGRLPCRRMYPGATGCNTIPNSEDVAPAAGRVARQPSNPKSDYETKPIRPFFSTKARNGSQIPSALACGSTPDATQMQPHATLSAKSLQPSRRDAVYPDPSPKWLLPKFPGTSDSTCPKRRGHYETK